jgi:hypothetical protein
MPPKLDTVMTLTVNELMLFSCADLSSLRAESLKRFPLFAAQAAPFRKRAASAEKSLKINGVILAIGFAGCALGIPGLFHLPVLDQTSAVLGIFATGGAGVLLGRDALELLRLNSSVKSLSVLAAEYKNFVLRCDAARMQNGCP